MTGLELTDTLIDGLQKTILAKKVARNLNELKMDVKYYVRNPQSTLILDTEESTIILACDISLPYALSDFAYFINYFEKIIDVEIGNKVDISFYLEQVTKNKDRIADTFQKINDNQNIVFTIRGNKQPLFRFIEQKFNYLNEEFQRVDDCYKILLAKKNGH